VHKPRGEMRPDEAKATGDEGFAALDSLVDHVDPPCENRNPRYSACSGAPGT
jgi:hypothetical protein